MANRWKKYWSLLPPRNISCILEIFMFLKKITLKISLWRARKWFLKMKKKTKTLCNEMNLYMLHGILDNNLSSQKCVHLFSVYEIDWEQSCAFWEDKCFLEISGLSGVLIRDFYSFCIRASKTFLLQNKIQIFCVLPWSILRPTVKVERICF